MAIAGRFRVHGDEAIELGLDGDRLVVRSPRARSEPLFRVGEDELARRDRETRYRVVREGDAVPAIEIVEPAAGDGAEERTVAPRMGADERLPSDLLAAGEISAAIAEYRRIRAARPGDRAVAELRLNTLGYQLAGRGEIEAALAVLELNTELYPDSANTWDSLADAALQSGDRERALSLYRRALEVLDHDSSADPDPGFKEQLRSKAEARVRELEGAGDRQR
jgi:tetratricopeptide (TPR) repeat protein